MSAFENGGQNPDVVVKLVTCAAADTKHLRKTRARKAAEPACRRFSLHAAVLEKGSPFFAALFLRWDHNNIKKSGTGLRELVVRDCEDLNSSELALELIYCDVLKEKPAGRLILESVTQGLQLLKACSFFLSDFGVHYCGASLAALPWSFEERRTILLVHQDLGLKLGKDLFTKMTSAAKKILEGLFAAAVSRDALPETDMVDFQVWTNALSSNRAMPRLQIQKQAQQGWMGLEPEFVQRIVDAQILLLPLSESTAIIRRLRVTYSGARYLETMLDSEDLKLLICKLSSLQWLSTFCLTHRIGLRGLQAVWGTPTAEAFVAQAMKTLFSLYEIKATKPLLEFFARSVFSPLQLLLEWACEDHQDFSETFREQLVGIWMPILLKFERARLLPMYVFQSSSAKAAFESLCEDSQKSLLQQWSKELSLSRDCSGEAIEGFLSSRLQSLVPLEEVGSLEAIQNAIAALKKARDYDSMLQLAKALALGVARALKENPELFEEVVKLWLDMPLGGLRQLRPGHYDILLETSATIIKEAASNQRAANRSLLQSMLPVLTDADTNGKLRKSIVKNFQRLLFKLSVSDQEHVVLEWTSSLAPVTSRAARTTLMSDVFAKWLEAFSEQKIAGA